MKTHTQERFYSNSAVREGERLGYGNELLQSHRTPSLQMVRSE